MVVKSTATKIVTHEQARQSFKVISAFFNFLPLSPSTPRS
jgi:hypothetical protein